MAYGNSASQLLYVEDERMLWRITRHKLSPRYEVHCAANDREAVDLFRQHHGTLEAIIMDIDLRGSTLDGAELTRLFRGTLDPAKTPDFARGVPATRVPIIFVTAYSDRYDEEKVRLVGAQGLLTKPIDFAALSLGLTRMHLERLGHSRRR